MLLLLVLDRFLADAEWEAVEKQTELADPYQTTDEEVSTVLKVSKPYYNWI